MAFSTDKFVGNVVSITVAVIILAMVAVPIIASATADITDDNLKNILNVIPIFIVIGVLMACIYMFMGKDKDQ